MSVRWDEVAGEWVTTAQERADAEADACEDPSHEWKVTLRSIYTVEVHAATEEGAKMLAEEEANNGMYEMGTVAEAIEAWQEPQLR